MIRYFLQFSIPFLVVVGFASACGPPKAGPPSPAISVEPQKAPAVDATPKINFIDPADLDPYFDGFIGQEAAQALQEDRLLEAIGLFDEFANEVSDIVLTPRARFMAAYLAERLGNNTRALAELPGLALELPLLADTAYERAACAALRLGKAERAIELSEKVKKSGTNGSEAAILRADALKKLGRVEEALEAYRHYLDNWPDGKRGIEAKSRIVTVLARLVKDDPTLENSAKEAFELLEHLIAQAPTNYWTKAAKTHEETLLDALGKTVKKSRRERPAAYAAYEKAAKLKRKMRNKEAEKAYAKVIRFARSKGELICRARLEQAVVVSRQRDHERAALLFDGVAETCRAPNIRVRALYRAAKAFQSKGRYHDAIRLYGEVETDFQTHSYADDARLHGARCHLKLGDRDTFREMLSSLLDLYPTGDMRSEALWALAHEAMNRDELPGAKVILEQYYQLFPRETGWYAAGRSGYWLGRVEERLGEVENASVRYEQVISGSPLTFYMVLAYNRLAAIDEKRAKAVVAELAPKGNAITARYPESLLEDIPALATGIELHRLGLSTLARREFDRLLREPHIPPEVYWLTAALLRSAGRFHEVKEITSHADTSWKQRYPAGNDHALWRLAFPTAYQEEVQAAATQSQVHPALIWAVMREESGFNPDIESWANAVGLMQLIVPTARSMGRQLEIKVNQRTLRRPGVNISLGSAYLALLKEKFDDHPVLTIAGYNAGEGAVGRWLKARPGDQVDIFVEEIPYDQTRGYTKRVIATFATYLFLYEDPRKLLALNLTLPNPR